MDVHPPKNGINRYWSIAIWLYTTTIHYLSFVGPQNGSCQAMPPQAKSHPPHPRSRCQWWAAAFRPRHRCHRWPCRPCSSSHYSSPGSTDLFSMGFFMIFHGRMMGNWWWTMINHRIHYSSPGSTDLFSMDFSMGEWWETDDQPW